MYRLLIVDDEAIVRRGIKKSVNWNELGIEMVAEAADGVEALSQVIENHPDIILLDINMPKMDGLEFASIVKKQYPKIKVVIITGYSEFEYARSALRAGVDDYIVKPITKEDVGAIIRAQMEKIKEEEKDAGHYPINEKSVKDNLLNSILKNSRLAQQDIKKFCELQKWEETQRLFFAVMRDYLSGCEMWNDGQTDSLAEFAILNIAEEILDVNECGYAFQTYQNELALLLICPQKDVESILNEINANLLNFLEIPVDFAVSEAGLLPQLPQMAEQARKALGYAFVLSNENIIFYKDVIKKQEQPFAYPLKTEMELLDKMFSGNMEDSLDLIDAFFDQLAEAAPDAKSCRNMILRLFLKVSNTVESLLSRAANLPDENVPEAFDPVAQTEQFDTLSEARDWLKKLYTDTYNYMLNIRSRSGQLFLKIKAYIEKNYADSELNLKKCSEDLFLSSNYISMILKKEAGRTFVDYLNEFRINKACELLSGSENRVYEVSTQVGFTHPTYFSCVFKKLTGVSPKQYKEKGQA